MDYIAILKRAYEITINSRNRYLWIWGILVGGSVASGFRGFTFPSSSVDSSVINSFGTGNNFNWENFLVQYGAILIALAVFVSIVAFILAIVSIVANGAILDSVRSISQGKKSGLKEGFGFGLSKFWRIFAIGLLLGLLVVISIIVLALPIVLLSIVKMYVLAIIYGILIFMVCLVFWVYLGLVSPYILRRAVLGDIGSWKAITSSWQFFIKNWKDILLIYLIMIAVGTIAAIALVLAILVVGGVLALVGYGIYLANLAAFIVYAIIFGLILFIALVIWSGAFTTFQSSVYTLAYLEMTKK